MFSVSSFKKCGGFNRIGTLGKLLINTAWPLTTQTRAYQQDLETTPETTLTWGIDKTCTLPSGPLFGSPSGPLSGPLFF